MKIVSTDNARQLMPPSSTAAHNEKRDFSAVFDETVQRSGDIKGSRSPSLMAGMTSVSGRWTALPELLPAPEAAADELLDSLERYQCRLNDPGANLKQIQPMVERMQSQAAGIESLLDQLPQSHPVRNILQDALALVSDEVGRFNSGHYVDRD
jgi:hypothetical protein